jgi:PadR family transcriptional regulator, regulatory protein AphA
MSLEYAILGFLSYKPLSGYDLKKIFDNSVQHFWSADQGQIYRTLARLADQGWAEIEVVEQSQRPDRKVYHLPPTGREELHRWLAGPVPSHESRSASLIQVFFAGQLSDEQLLVKFEQVAAFSRAILATYQQIPAVIGSYTQEFASPREAFCWNLTLELGIRSVQAQLDWAESIIERIRNKQIPAA